MKNSQLVILIYVFAQDTENQYYSKLLKEINKGL